MILDIGIALFAASLLLDSAVTRWWCLPVGRTSAYVMGLSASIAAGVLLSAYGYWSTGGRIKAALVLAVLGAMPVWDRARRPT